MYETLAVPTLTPDTVPVVPAPATVAIATLLTDHVPPAGLQVSTVEPGAHNVAVPEMAAGKGLTVTVTTDGADAAPPPEGVTTQL